jgi:ABC-2 type transport system permease protein
MTTLVLARNEWIKTTRRLAFWITLLCLSLLLGLMFFQRYSAGVSDDNVSPLGFPDGWGFIFSEPGPLPAMFAAIVIILLVASEFSWRTARQNVIDGLSREQFYLGKVLLIPGISLAFVLLVALLGVVFALPGAWAGAGVAGEGAPGVSGIFGRHDLAMAGGALLTVAGMGSMALFIASLVRSSGPAMAIYFFYIAFAEQILTAVTGRFIPGAAALTPYAPSNLFMGLPERALYYPHIREAATARALESGSAVPSFADPVVLATAALGWIAFFLLAGFVAFRRRDL